MPSEKRAANIAYASDELLEYYATRRQSWEEVYPSEKSALKRCAQTQGGLGRVLDVGCACGGMFKALNGRFELKSYLGLDIHPGLIAAAKRIYTGQDKAEFVAADIVAAPEAAGRESFDSVLSLGCADWNLDFAGNLAACWALAARGGGLVLTLRLTSGPGARDPEQSYQYVCASPELPEDVSGLERAPYQVFNFYEALSVLLGLTPRPDEVAAFGYYGSPSPLAVTPLDKVVFSAWYLHKSEQDKEALNLELNLPAGLFAAGQD